MSHVFLGSPPPQHPKFGPTESRADSARNARRRWLAGGAALGLATLLPTVADAAPRVEFELCMVPGLPPTAAQEWLQALQSLDLDGLRIREFKGEDQPRVETLGAGASARHKVTGVIAGANDLRLPGGRFGLGDKARLVKWIDKLKEGGGEEAVTAKTGAFGMTNKQLVELHTALSGRLRQSTRGKPTTDIVRAIASRIEVPLTVSPEVRDRFADEEVADELEGIAAGTSLAAIVRPLGLVVAPQLQGGRPRLIVVDQKSAKEFWPIGWPTDANTGELAPGLLKFLDVEIDDTPLHETVAAIQGRVELPFLFDHNGLAKHGVDLEKVKVTIPRGRTYYSKVLSQALGKARLKYELRIDEAEQPFLWISSKLD